jgi:putative transcriptional regulator
MRVVTPTPNAVVLHGLDEDDVWEHAADLARIDGFSLAVADGDISTMLDGLDDLP